MENILRGAQELDNIIKQGYLEKKSKGINQTHEEWVIPGAGGEGRREGDVARL